VLGEVIEGLGSFFEMKTHYTVAIIGGGQAGLSVSYCLQERGIEHVIFEKHRVGHAWRSQRWDSFCLVTPNWQCQLPGFPYSGEDPHGFMGRDAIVEYIEAYVRAFEPPVIEGIEVTQLTRPQAAEPFVLTTSQGTYTADRVVVATGGYHQPKIPPMAERLPETISQIHSSAYKTPTALPDSAVLVVGTGQSGCQIAEDLHLAGRQVYLCVGGAPRSPRRYRGKDVVAWLDMVGYYNMPVHEHPDKENVRHKTNHYVTGRGGGREIDLRHFALEGMQLCGRLADIRDNCLYFQDDLKQNLDRADEVAASFKGTIDRFIETQGIDAPTEAPYTPVWEPQDPITSLDLEEAGIRTVIWCLGFGTNFQWIEIPVFDGKGYPGHDRGVTHVEGLYFIGLPWLYTWGSGRFSGIARDAIHIAGHIHWQRTQVQPTSGPGTVDTAAFGS